MNTIDILSFIARYARKSHFSPVLSLSLYLCICILDFACSTEAVSARCAVIIMISRSGTKPLRFCGLVTSNRVMCVVPYCCARPHTCAANTSDSTRAEKARPPRDAFCSFTSALTRTRKRRENRQSVAGVKNRRNSSRSLLLWIFTCMLSVRPAAVIRCVGGKDLRRRHLVFPALRRYSWDISISDFMCCIFGMFPTRLSRHGNVRSSSKRNASVDERSNTIWTRQLWSRNRIYLGDPYTSGNRAAFS